MKHHGTISTLTQRSGSLKGDHFICRQREDRGFLLKNTVTNYFALDKGFAVSPQNNVQLLWMQISIFKCKNFIIYINLKHSKQPAYK